MTKSQAVIQRGRAKQGVTIKRQELDLYLTGSDTYKEAPHEHMVLHLTVQAYSLP